MKNFSPVMILVIIAVAAGGFLGGMKYQQSKNPRFGNFQGRNGQNQQRTGFRPVNGEIINQDETSITVKLQDGSSKIIFISDQTAINKSGAGTPQDLKTGERVAVFGQENSDGSLTAQNIQLNPAFDSSRNQTRVTPSR